MGCGRLRLSTDTKASEVKSLFNAISPTYDRLNHVLSLNIDKLWRKKTIALIQKEKKLSFKALDLCCGTHDMGLECLRQFPNAAITAMDFSEEMIAAGANKIKTYLDNGQINTVCADALNMPFEDARFDVIFCAYGVRNFSDPHSGLLEIKRVLRPGGQVLILDFFKPKNFFSRIFHRTYAVHVLPRVGSWVSGHPDAYAYLSDSIRGFVTTDDMIKQLVDLGFQKVTARDFFGGISSCVVAQ